MKTGTLAAIVAASSCVIYTPAAVAQVAGTLTQNPETGHYYQVFQNNGGTWDAAQAYIAIEANVPCLDQDGMTIACSDPDANPPHLATVTSAREELFVDTLRDDEFTGGVLTQEQTWIGGIQESDGEPGNTLGDVWRWVNEEGSFPAWSIRTGRPASLTMPAARIT